jgi:hypothetical protein
VAGKVTHAVRVAHIFVEQALIRFIYGLVNDAVSSSHSTESNARIQWVMNWKGYGRKRSLFNFKVLSRYFLGETGEMYE